MRKLIACVGLAALLAGCGPSDIFDCKMRASQAPTAPGVAVASMACEKKFPKALTYEEAVDMQKSAK